MVAELSVTRVGLVIRETAPLLVIACVYFFTSSASLELSLILMLISPKM